MAPSLRRWQVDAQQLVVNDWSPGLPGKMVVACTGSGKTVFGLDAVIRSLGPKGRLVWLAHREELLDAPLEDIHVMWPELKHDAGIVQADRDAADKRLIFASVDTLRNAKRLDAILAHGHPDIIVVDEAHHSVSNTHDAAIRGLLGPNTRVLGLTATPDREDAKDLGKHWRIVYQYGIVDAVDEGVLLPPFAAVNLVPNLNLTAISGRRDYDDAELGEALLKAHIVEHTVCAMATAYDAVRLPFRDEQRRLTCQGRSGIVFTATVEQARQTVESLRADGWTASLVHGGMARADRQRVIRAFKKGEIRCLVNPAVLTEGTNLPSASFVVLARPTKSWSLAIQCIGRALRTAKGKPETDALVLDLAGATDLHSLIGAPILIGSEGCTHHADQRHRYLADGEAGGACECGKRVPCVANEGPHAFRPNVPNCSKCGAIRCPSTDDGMHAWRPLPEGVRECLGCGATYRNPLASMVGRPGNKGDKEAVAWRPLGSGLYGVQLGDFGACFNVQVGPDQFRPFFIRHGQEEALPLSLGPVSAAHSRQVTDDVARKVAAVEGQRGGVPHGARWLVERQRMDLETMAARAGLRSSQ